MDTKEISSNQKELIPTMKLTELERDILRFALDYTYGYLTDIKEYPEKVEEQIEALKTLTQKLLS